MVTIARSPPKGMTTVVGVRVRRPRRDPLDTLLGEHRPDDVASDVVAERRGDRGRQPQPGGADGSDRPSTWGAQELGGEPLLAQRRQRLEPDEREVEKDRRRNDEISHGRPRITASRITRRAHGWHRP